MRVLMALAVAAVAVSGQTRYSVADEPAAGPPQANAVHEDVQATMLADGAVKEHGDLALLAQGRGGDARRACSGRVAHDHRLGRQLVVPL